VRIYSLLTSLFEGGSILTSPTNRNSVSPPPMAALARTNAPWRAEQQQAAAA